VGERDSERDLVRDGFNRLVDYGGFIVDHVLKMRPNNLQHQHVMFSVWALYLKMIQGSEDVIGSRMCPRPGRKTTKNLDFVVLAGKLGYDELEGDISATRRKGC